MGIDPDRFWTSTLRELNLMCAFYTNNQMREWERTRNLEFSLYNVQYNQMNGKKMFKALKRPRDLYELTSDKPITVVKPPREESEKAVNNMKEWLKKI